MNNSAKVLQISTIAEDAKGGEADIVKCLGVFHFVVVQLIDVLDLQLAMAICCSDLLLLLYFKTLNSKQELAVGAILHFGNGLVDLSIEIEIHQAILTLSNNQVVSIFTSSFITYNCIAK